MPNVARDLLRGAIDLHIHAAPDIVPRLMNDLQLAEAAREAGMAALVLKSHHMMTADRAQIARSLYPEVGVFGGLALNVPSCGGLNPEAVKSALRMGARILWLPTFSAANHIQATSTRVTGNLGAMAQGFAPIPAQVLDREGNPLPELREILALVAQADVVLATGHLSVPEIKVVVDAALAAGVRKILVNHPELWLVGMSVEDQRALAARGVMLERCIRSVTSKGNEAMSPRLIADQIKAVGAESTVMATDYGQVDSPPPPQGMLRYIEEMLEHGISATDVEMMVKVNPARMLGFEI